MRDLIDRLIIFVVVGAFIYGAFWGVMELRHAIHDASRQVEQKNAEIINIMEGDVPAGAPDQ